MHSGIFGHIGSLYPIKALFNLSTKGSTWSSRLKKIYKFWVMFKSLYIYVFKSVLNIGFHGNYRPDLRD